MFTVLLVDPSAFTRKKLQRELEGRGYRVIACAQGEAAFRAAADCRPDVAVVARWLPDVDGLSAMRQLRYASAFLPVIFTGTSARPGDPWSEHRVVPMEEPLGTPEEHKRIFRAIARLLRPVVA